MRIVRSIDEVAAQVELATSEAASAFGDSTVFCEPYVEHGRHVEVQVVGDTHGGVLVLGERDCSIQRRHQKVVEETPAPGLAEETRSAMHDAARAVALGIGYVGAGTVEFLLDPSGSFFFLEMNTRLQVEHPVTECVYGVDLVAMQIAVAEGRPLDEMPGPRGHAVEVRLYAEDPVHDWQPQSGTLTRFEVPGVAARFANPAGPGIRLDAGFESGSQVGTFYDAMLAKVVAWAPTRDQALRQLAGVLARTRIHGVRTNRDLLVNTLRHPAVVSGDVSTDFFERHGLAEVARPAADQDAVRLSAFVAAIGLAERDRQARTEQRGIQAGWRNVTSQPQTTRFTYGEAQISACWYGGRTGYRSADQADVQVLEASPTRVILTELSGPQPAIAGQRPDKSGVRRAFELFVDGDRIDVESALGHVALTRRPRFVDPADQIATGSLLAPMPGSVVRVAVTTGDEVSAGETVLVLEAMKMQHTVSAPHDGVVTDLPVTVGDQVAAGSVLAVVQVSAGPADETTGSTQEEENP
jgi:propionyl-CoA carboxylase alpha chain